MTWPRPPAMRCLRCARGCSKRRGSMGSPSYSQVLRLRSIRLRPRGNRPVLFSRMLNSIVFTLLSIAAQAPGPYLDTCPVSFQRLLKGYNLMVNLRDNLSSHRGGHNRA